MKKRRSQLIRACITKNWSWNDQNAIAFKWSDVQEEDKKDIALANFIESLQKQTVEEIFQKK